MMFDEQHIFINGDSYRASGRDAHADAAPGGSSDAWPAVIWRVPAGRCAWSC
jgi:hypothetical protein